MLIHYKYFLLYNFYKKFVQLNLDKFHERIGVLGNFLLDNINQLINQLHQKHLINLLHMFYLLDMKLLTKLYLYNNNRVHMEDNQLKKLLHILNYMYLHFMRFELLQFNSFLEDILMYLLLKVKLSQQLINIHFDNFQILHLILFYLNILLLFNLFNLQLL